MTYVTSFVLVIFAYSTFVFSSIALDLGQWPHSASIVKLGGIAGFSSQASAIFENPASLATVKEASLSLFATSMLNQESKLQSAALNLPSKKGCFALGFIQHSVPNIPKSQKLLPVKGLDSDYPLIEGSFNYEERLTLFSYSSSLLQNAHWSMSFSYYQYKMDKVSGQGKNLNLGFLFPYSDNLEFSWSFKNILINSQMKYSNKTALHWPFFTQLGYCYQLNNINIYSQLAAQFNQYEYSQNQWLFYPSLAITVPVFYKPQLFFSMAITDQRAVARNKYQLSTGLALHLSKISIDFAYEKSDYFPASHRFFLSFHVRQFWK